MLLDDQNRYSDAQALTVTAASEDVIDHGSDRNLGIGEPMALMITLTVAADNTTGDETYTAQLQTDTVEGFGSPTAVGGLITIPAGSAIGTRFVAVLPPDTTMERFSRVNFTLGGTTPTVTLNADLIPLRVLQNEFAYPSGFTIS